MSGRDRPIRVALVGNGKMGRAIAALAAERGAEVAATIGRGTRVDRAALGGADVAIEFTEPAAAVDNARACLAAGVPVVVGTTGWLEALPALSRDVEAAGGRLLWAANFSVGVNAMLAVAAAAARALRGAGFDAHLVETHHAAKRDAPSGTALALARAAEPEWGAPVPTTSVRVGHVPGTHALVFDAPFEQVVVRHEARDRRVFAEGALVAARWLAAERRPGVYTMQDVLAPRAGGGGVMAESLGAGLRGCGTAIVTPFTSDGAVDEPALRAFVRWQLAEGVHFLVPCGSTGEAATLAPEEHRRVVEITVDEVAGRVPVVAGAGSNDTQRAIALSREMRDAGATHLLHVSPAYSKPPQRGIEAHFRAVADAVDLPIVLYNVPGRTASNMDAATTLRLAEVSNIVAVKEASANMLQIDAILRDRPDGFAVLSGDDQTAFATMAHGGDGVISVVSNATPRLMAELCERALAGDLAGARERHARLVPWMAAAFVESNPIPVKAALAMMGHMQNVLRLPLVPLAESHAPAVRAALVAAGAL